VGRASVSVPPKTGKSLEPMNPSSLNGRIAAVALGAAALLAGCAHHDKVVVVQPATQTPAPQTVVVHDNPAPAQTNTIVVHDAPPPPRDESVPTEPPSPDQVWAPGHWEYQDNNYTWVQGTWISRPQPNEQYVAPHWESRADGWVYVAGYWR
jgi:hypothetical protein